MLSPLTATESTLRAAIEEGQLSIAVQPLVDIRTGRLVRVEALSRCSIPFFGSTAPTDFIPLAEAHGLITPLTLAVARAVASALPEWCAIAPGLRATINVSPSTLVDPDFVDQLVAAVAAAGCHPARLGIEVTESALMRKPAMAQRALERLREVGMRIEIDDFGTGYSSLGRLADLPIDALKIDRQFIARMARDHKREAIVRACIALAHDLGLEAVAEGVEDRETWELLRTLGCDTAQGFYAARPMPAATFAGWLATWETELTFLRRFGVAAEPVEGSAASRDILVVDDKPVVAKMIRDILEQEGFRVITAGNGADALRAIERARPAVVLLDMQMPVLDGPGFARALRARRLDVPIVVMTAGPGAERWATELAADGYLRKPFDIDGLLAVAHRYAERN